MFTKVKRRNRLTQQEPVFAKYDSRPMSGHPVEQGLLIIGASFLKIALNPHHAPQNHVDRQPLERLAHVHSCVGVRRVLETGNHIVDALRHQLEQLQPEAHTQRERVRIYAKM